MNIGRSFFMNAYSYPIKILIATETINELKSKGSHVTFVVKNKYIIKVVIDIVRDVSQ